MFLDVAAGFVWIGLKSVGRKLKCKLTGHDWDNYYGYHEERPAKGAHCRRKGCKAVYNG